MSKVTKASGYGALGLGFGGCWWIIIGILVILFLLCICFFGFGGFRFGGYYW
ncbi:hypothetical protein [Hazenella coriacea]|uniref:hypothetical protein n=1 Tax=Hazenella coriacea TaxID=1179467 RepID=UPI0014050FAF|nr:hypothetical protein [Hazenella coriacea]